jgi:hypothetical protein
MTEGVVHELWRTLTVLIVLACSGGGSDPASLTLSGSTFCERASSLASQLGCTAPVLGCEEPPSHCVELGKVWLDCAAADVTQCLCEGDGDLNCEGSFKPNEGPARCIEPMTQYNACE